jgi:hypothetical protein
MVGAMRLGTSFRACVLRCARLRGNRFQRLTSFEKTRSLRCKTQHSPSVNQDEDPSPRALCQRRTLGRRFADARAAADGSRIDASPPYVEVITQECDGTPSP